MKPYFREFHGPTDWGWVQSHLPLKRVEDTTGIMCIDLDRHATVAGCIMDNWTHTSVQVHLILEDPLAIRHGFFQEVADYVFNEAGRELMIGLVPSNNEKALSVDKKIGFQELARVPDAVMGGVDMVILTMTREQCRFYVAREPATPVAATG